MTTVKRVLVTGGGGFLGSYIVDKLIERNYEVASFSRKIYPELEEKGVICLTGSLTEYDDVENAFKGYDAIIHTAALAGIWGKWEDYLMTNFVGTQNVVAACKKLGIKHLVYTSSPSVVFDGFDINGDSEKIGYAKKHWCHYPVTKKLAEKLVLESNSETLVTSALRPHLIWGPRDPHFVPRLVERAKSGRLKQIGKGENLVDVIYVENAAAAHVDLLETQVNNPKNVEGKVYFIGQEEPVKLWDFVNNLITTSGGPAVKRKIPFWLGYIVATLMEGFYALFGIKKEPLLTRFLTLQLAKSHYFDHSNAVKDFGYKVEVSTKEGFERLSRSSA